MMIRVAWITSVLLAAAAAGCGHGAGGTLPVDTTIAPFHAPDISDITGIDDDDDAGSAAPAAAPAPAPAPAAAHAKG